MLFLICNGVENGLHVPSAHPLSKKSNFPPIKAESASMVSDRAHVSNKLDVMIYFQRRLHVMQEKSRNVVSFCNWQELSW